MDDEPGICRYDQCACGDGRVFGAHGLMECYVWPDGPGQPGARWTRAETHVEQALATPEFARAYAAGRVPARVRGALCWILGLPLIMGALIGMAYALHGLAMLCAWF